MILNAFDMSRIYTSIKPILLKAPKQGLNTEPLGLTHHAFTPMHFVTAFSLGPTKFCGIVSEWWVTTSNLSILLQNCGQSLSPHRRCPLSHTPCQKFQWGQDNLSSIPSRSWIRWLGAGKCLNVPLFKYVERVLIPFHACCQEEFTPFPGGETEALKRLDASLIDKVCDTLSLAENLFSMKVNECLNQFLLLLIA